MTVIFKKYFDIFKQPNPNFQKIFKCVHKQPEKTEYRDFSIIFDNTEFLAKNFTGWLSTF